MTEWLTFGATVVLLGITGWYALITRDLSKSARQSATSANAAAELAAQSVAAAVARVKVEFDVSPNLWFGRSGGLTLGLRLVCTGATVFLHEVRILEAYRSSAHSEAGEDLDSIFVDSDGLTLATTEQLPSRIHSGEAISFSTSPAYDIDSGFAVAIIRAQVRYSLDGVGQGIIRRVEWDGVRGIDY